jgi:hypothetical protein
MSYHPSTILSKACPEFHHHLAEVPLFFWYTLYREKEKILLYRVWFIASSSSSIWELVRIELLALSPHLLSQNLHLKKILVGTADLGPTNEHAAHPWDSCLCFPCPPACPSPIRTEMPQPRVTFDLQDCWLLGVFSNSYTHPHFHRVWKILTLQRS